MTKSLLALAHLAAVGLFTGGLIVGYLLSRPAHTMIGPPPADLGAVTFPSDSGAILALATAPLLGIAPGDPRPIDHMAKVRAPLLILIGAIDTYTTVAETNAMFARAPEPKSLWIVDGAGHVDLREHAPEPYRARLSDFLSRHLRRPP